MESNTRLVYLDEIVMYEEYAKDIWDYKMDKIIEKVLDEESLKTERIFEKFRRETFYSITATLLPLL